MGRGKKLTEEEKALILTMHEEGYSFRYIAQSAHRSKTAVDNFVKKWKSGGPVEKKPRPTKISLEQRCALIREASKDGASARRIKTELNLPVTVRRVQQILQGACHRHQSSEMPINDESS